MATSGEDFTKDVLQVLEKHGIDVNEYDTIRINHREAYDYSYGNSCGNRNCSANSVLSLGWMLICLIVAMFFFWVLIVIAAEHAFVVLALVLSYLGVCLAVNAAGMFGCSYKWRW